MICTGRMLFHRFLTEVVYAPIKNVYKSLKQKRGQPKEWWSLLASVKGDTEFDQSDREREFPYFLGKFAAGNIFIERKRLSNR